MVVKNGNASHGRIVKKSPTKTNPSLLISLLLSHTNLFISKRKTYLFSKELQPHGILQNKNVSRLLRSYDREGTGY